MRFSVGIPTFFIAFILLFLPVAIQAQRSFSGYITDHKKQPLPFAAIAWKTLPDSIITVTSMADSNGFYQLTTTTNGPGILNIQATGFAPMVKLINNADTNTQRLSFELKTTTHALGEVTVTGSKPILEHRADRTIFNVENSIASAGSDALEALKKAPGVHVSSSNDISLAGKSSVSIMINNKLVQLSGEELAAMLQSIPADQLSRIEVITTPPAKYDAAGNSGIISIITKKSMKNGLNGNIELGYQQNTSAAQFGNGSFNYRHNKLNIYGNGNSFNGVEQPNQQYTTFFPGQRTVQQNTERTTQVFDRFQLGADYNISKNSVIGILYTLGFGGPHWKSNESVAATAFRVSDNHIDSVMRTSAQTRERGLRNVANLNYEWKIDTMGKRLNMDADYFTRTGRKNRNFTTQDEFEDGSYTGTASDNHTSGKQVVDIRTAKADVEWPTTFAHYTFGAKASFIHNTSDNLFQYLDAGNYITDTGKTNSFDYHENTQAAYFSAEKELDKWNLQLGLRGEYTQTKGYSPTLNQANTNDYFKLFPTVFVQYTPQEKQVFGFNYSRRIERPDFWIMNPFRTYTTASSYEEGNPFLQPSFSNNFELNYTLNSAYTFTIYSQQVKDYFTQVSQLDTATQALSFHQANAGKLSNYGFTASAIINPLPWWECNLQLNAYYTTFSSSYYTQQVSYHKAACSVTNSNDLTLNKKKTFLAELNWEYQSSQQTDFDVQRPTYNIGCGFKVLLLKKTLIAAVNADDIFRTEKTSIYNLYNGTLINGYNDERGLRISLSWKFGNRNIQAKRERIPSDDDDSKRVK